MDELTALAIAGRDGDRVALAAFVRRAQPDVWRLCAALASQAEADDLAQDALIRVLRQLHTFRGESPVRPWVLTIARRTVADAIRSARWRRRLLTHRRSATTPDPTRALDLELLVAGLDDDQRQAFVLTQILGVSYEEAAQICDCPIGTIRSRVARARSTLVARLEESA